MTNYKIKPPRPRQTTRPIQFNRADAYRLSEYRRNPVYFVINELGETPSMDQVKLLMACADIENKSIILSAGRGAGKSMVVSWIVAWSMAVYPDVFGKYNAVILGGSSEQSKIMYGYFKDYVYKTKYLEGRLLDDPTKSETKFEGGFVKALTASENAVRGPHPELLILDEVCATDDEIVRSALPMISGSRHGRIIMLSTPHKFFGTFQDYWQNAELYEYKKFGPWPLTNCSWIDQRWVARMKLQYTPQKFGVEILGQPAEGGAMAFYDKWIDNCTAKEPFAINLNYDHDGGIDWGHTNPSVLVKAQKYQGKINIPGPEQAWQYKLFPMIQEEIAETYKKSRGDTYYADSSHIGENERMALNGINTMPVIWTDKNKPALTELAAHLMYNNLLRFSPDNTELLKQLKKYRWEETASGKEKLTKKGTDYVEAFLLSLYELYDSGWMDKLESVEDKFLVLA